ncbi:type VI secretion system protein ImpK [Pseudomonas lini]|jgi:type VI secretion system protein ImpK|uniref:type VI secretion system protein TssL, short form n=1 Tax=Pseudomonas lini TaxID=163011 RepID=UPI00277D6E5F|nr:type VI secretion system protein TssL, short form [Pseudomonas lini]MDQ0123404.1 type VI secretion system protein ImpK [Pseudomonas lini]
MSRVISNRQTATATDVDALLQDSYLLVVELRHGACAQNADELWARCAGQIEFVRQALERAGLSQRSIDHISHAQCALLDETVLSRAKDHAHAQWAREPLQAKFFNRHQAGEFLYEDMRDVLREPAPDPQVLMVFHRVLMLGFQGRYRELNDPEREQLLTALNEHVAPMESGLGLSTQVSGANRIDNLRWLRSPLPHVLAAGLLLFAVWWGLDRLLSGLIATLLPGAA